MSTKVQLPLELIEQGNAMLRQAGRQIVETQSWCKRHLDEDDYHLVGGWLHYAARLVAKARAHHLHRNEPRRFKCAIKCLKKAYRFIWRMYFRAESGRLMKYYSLSDRLESLCSFVRDTLRKLPRLNDWRYQYKLSRRQSLQRIDASIAEIRQQGQEPVAGWFNLRQIIASSMSAV